MIRMLVTNNAGWLYVIPAARAMDWEAWLDDESEPSLPTPKYAQHVEGEPLRFVLESDHDAAIQAERQACARAMCKECRGDCPGHEQIPTAGTHASRIPGGGEAHCHAWPIHKLGGQQ